MSKDRILVVDDDPDNRAMISHFLQNWGYEVEDAKNGKVAIDKVKSNPPSLVLLDVEMPEMDGFEACERLKTDPETEWIPVIMFTGLEKIPHRIRGLRQGADDYIVKTVEPDELRTRIELVLKRSKRYATLATSPLEDEQKRDPELALSVSLTKIPFPEAIRLVLAHGKNGIIQVTNDNRTATVHVDAGAVIHAKLEDEIAEDAFYEMALWKNGRFDFQEADPGGERTILTPTRALLVEASRRLDAWSMISSKVRSFDWIPKCVSLSGAQSIRLTRSDWAVIRLVDGRRSIRDIVDELKTDAFEAGRIVYSLVTVGVLRLDETPDARDDTMDLVPRRGEVVLVSEPFELTAAEWDFLALVDGVRSLGAIRASLDLPVPSLMKTVKILRDKGLLLFTAREQRQRKGA